MGVMLVFGIIGYIMKKTNFPVVAVLLGVILGPMFEANVMRALRITFNSPSIFFEFHHMPGRVDPCAHHLPCAICAALGQETTPEEE